MIIKDRLIEVEVTEALAIAGKGEKVRCVGDGTGLMTIADALEGLTFFAPESALTEKPEPIKLEASKDEIAKLAKSAFMPGGPAHFDTPEARTRAIVDSVERYDEEHGDPPTARQDAEDTEDVKNEAPKQELPKKGRSAEGGAGVRPFRGSPNGGGR